ncbi:MAG: helix-turn-helix domain-containing protein [Actinomycetes bacterium]
MSGDGLPVFPGFREAAARRRDVIAALSEARRASGLSQTTVAARMGTSQPVVARLESGAVDVRLSTLARYAAAVGHDLELRVTPRAGADSGLHAGRPADPRADPRADHRGGHRGDPDLGGPHA